LIPAISRSAGFTQRRRLYRRSTAARPRRRALAVPRTPPSGRRRIARARRVSRIGPGGPADPGEVAPDGPDAAGRHRPPWDDAVTRSTRPTSSAAGRPPALSSRKWAREYHEVKQIGSSTNSTLWRRSWKRTRRPGRSSPAPVAAGREGPRGRGDHDADARRSPLPRDPNRRAEHPQDSPRSEAAA
jgi:hypothetical protein